MSLYVDIYNSILKEMLEREGCESVQRESEYVKREAIEATKECLGTVMESIERKLYSS